MNLRPLDPQVPLTSQFLERGDVIGELLEDVFSIMTEIRFIDEIADGQRVARRQGRPAVARMLGAAGAAGAALDGMAASGNTRFMPLVRPRS